MLRLEGGDTKAVSGRRAEFSDEAWNPYPIMQLIPVQYGRRRYPNDIAPKLQEVAGHFDAKRVSCQGPYSLHTEYSYGSRDFSSPGLSVAPGLSALSRRGIPQLWHSETWAEAFSRFVIDLCRQVSAPSVVEIHPPFNDYCPTVDDFLDRYSVFEGALRAAYPDVEILIENRCGSMYPGGKFLVISAGDMTALAERIDARRLHLRFALDLPQVLTDAGDAPNLSAEEVSRLMLEFVPLRRHIRGLHLWGKKRNVSGRRIAHQGNLTDYFDGDEAKKKAFLAALRVLCDDGVDRYLVPEVNSTDADVALIVDDLRGIGCQFR